MNNFIKGLIVAGVIFGLAFVVMSAKQDLGSAPSGLPATLHIATTTAIGPQENIEIFSEYKPCSSRVISVLGDSGVMLTFGEPTNGDVSSATLSGIIGHYQAASTTVAYDGGIYGCGEWNAYAFASTTITTTEL